MQKTPSPSPFNYSVYWLLVLLLVLIGLVDTAYLAISHYRNYTDITYSSFCALSRAINCDTVSQSPWSILLGLPVAVWGFLGYLFFAILLLAAKKKSRNTLSLWSLLFLLGLIFSGSSLYFGYISASRIHSYCILCILSYGISFSLLFYAWIIRRRFDLQSFPGSLARSLTFYTHNTFLKLTTAILLITFLGLKFFLPQYWTYAMPGLSSEIAIGMTEEYHPWIGAETPTLTIEEYSDYQCFQCYKMHFMLRRLMTRYPDKIRLIHRHFPMDKTVNEIIVPTPFHIGAGKMALMAIYASTQKKFWQTNDALFELGRDKKTFNTRILADKTGLTAGALAAATRDQTLRKFLQKDIREGMLLGITGTPSFVIDGQLYQGSIPSEILKKAIK